MKDFKLNLCAIKLKKRLSVKDSGDRQSGYKKQENKQSKFTPSKLFIRRYENKMYYKLKLQQIVFEQPACARSVLIVSLTLDSGLTSKEIETYKWTVNNFLDYI